MTTKKFYTVREFSNMMELLKMQENQLSKTASTDWIRHRLEKAHAELWNLIDYIYKHSNKNTIDKVIAYNMGCGGGEQKIYIK